MGRTRLLLAACLFALGCAGAFALAVGVTYWVDPQHERFDPAVLARADAGPRPCAITASLVGDSPAIASFKRAVLRARRPSLVVLGLSRSLEIRARAGEAHFANLSAPGLGPADLLTLVQRLHALGVAHETVYLDVEPVWFDSTWSAFLGLDQSGSLRRYISGPALLASVRTLAAHPLRGPHSFAVATQAGRCVLHPSGQPVKHPLWEVDGSIEWELRGKVPRKDLLRSAGLLAARIDGARVAQVARAVDLMRSYGWRVVGFTPPLAPWVLAQVRSSVAATAALRDFTATATRLLGRDGYPYLDLVGDPGRFHCGDADYAQDDGSHPDAACSARIRLALDAAVK
jgi:hypothetical protein